MRADSGSAHLASRQQIKRSNTYKTLSYKWDLFIPFMELGLKLLCEGGGYFINHFRMHIAMQNMQLNLVSGFAR